MTRASDTARTLSGGAVFNEGSADVDLRVESNGNANMLVVDGGNDKVSIGTATQDLTLTVNESLSLRNSNRAAGINVDSDGNVYFGTATSASNIVFETGHTTTGLPSTGTTKMTVAGSGAVTIANGLTLTDGNLVVASGHGIDFSATSDATGRTDELLQDYEEGAYTPTVVGESSGSYTLGDSATKLAYTKIGKIVQLQGQIHITGKSSPSGVVRVSLPFATGNGTELSDRAVGSVAFDSASSGNGVAHNSGNLINFYVSTNSSFGVFRSSEENEGAGSLNQSHIDTNDRFTIGITYMTFG
ncbi:hypothetical protein N8970_00640 [bacterium]|nr:hypothetical protein [bacterium]